jgi:hypothetical protein
MRIAWAAARARGDQGRRGADALVVTWTEGQRALRVRARAQSDNVAEGDDWPTEDAGQWPGRQRPAPGRFCGSRPQSALRLARLALDIPSKRQ